MDEKGLRDSFVKIKEDMLFLSNEVLFLKEEIQNIKKILEEIQNNQKINLSKQSTDNQQIQHISNTNSPLYAGIKPYFKDSNGNEGVPADSQQTVSRYSAQLKRTFNKGGQHLNNTQILSEIRNQINKEYEISESQKNENLNHSINQEKELTQLSKVISNLKNELKDKFKRLSKQEFTIFSALYLLEEQSKEISYKDLAIYLGLTESSIRDYISRLIHKGIPIIKEKINNKTILLRISPELRNIATLDILSKINSREIN